jgi:catechol 2,3-dioxygenase-like lactoylglutathione lyase family enzyme
MKGIDHLVLAGRDLDAMRERYAALGFKLTPKARHPFGTGNSLVQLDGVFLELLGVVEPKSIPEAKRGQFSFGAFNRDFLRRREGFSMLALDSWNCKVDVERFRAGGIPAYGPFEFSREATLPTGSTKTVSFSLAFSTMRGAPHAGFFCCRHRTPREFWQAGYQRHATTAWTVAEVWMVAERPHACGKFLETFAKIRPEALADSLMLRTARGNLLIETPKEYRQRTGLAPPSTTHGPAFAGFSVGVDNFARARAVVRSSGLPFEEKGVRLYIAPKHVFGTAIAFEPGSRAYGGNELFR